MKTLCLILVIITTKLMLYSQCTTFCLAANDTVLLGNTLDWNFGDGYIMINKRNVSKTALGFQNPAKWISKYGSITINQWGREFPMRGMNEAGLAVGEMTLAETKYPEPDERGAISNPQWIQYQLDNCATVEEVIQSDALIRLDPKEYTSHFFVADKDGNCAAIEWLNGKLVYHTTKSLPFPALTNSTYESLLQAYQNNKNTNGNYYSSINRFCRAAELIETYKPEQDGSIIDYAWKIHTSVQSPQRTKWLLVLDITNLRFYLKTNVNQEIRYLDLSSCDFSCDTPVKMVDANKSVSGDLSQYLFTYDPILNHNLIKEMARLHKPITGVVGEWYIENSAAYPETTHCMNEEKNK